MLHLNVYNLLLVGCVTVYATHGSINITATIGRYKTRNNTLVLSKQTIESANDYCHAKGYGALISSGDDAIAVIDARHRFYTDFQWNENSEHVWVGLYKVSVHWYKLANCWHFIGDFSVISNQTDGEKQCVLLNTTTDSNDTQHVLYATSCDQSHAFLCSKIVDELEYEEFNNSVIAWFPSIMKKSIFEPAEFEWCWQSVRDIYKYLVMEYWHENQTCVIYKTKYIEYEVEVELSETDHNTTLIVKTARDNYESITPNINASRTINYPITCTDPSSSVTVTSSYGTEATMTSSTSTSATAASVPSCAASESLACVCSSSVTSQELQQQIENIKTENLVQKTSLSSYTRTKKSATDSRPSSTTMGVLGILLITSVCVLVVASDMPVFIKSIKRLKKMKWRKMEIKCK